MGNDDKSVKELVLEKSSPFRRKLVYQSVEAKYKNNIHLKLTSSDNDRVLVVQKTTTAKDRELVRKQEFDEFMTRLHSDYGFSEVIDQIVESVSVFFLLKIRVLKSGNQSLFGSKFTRSTF